MGRLIVVAIVLSCAVWAHPAESPFELGRPAISVFTDRDGLPQNSIESMAIGPLGRLWATTREGMATFDGTRWEAVPLPEKSMSNWPRSVAASQDGSLWIGAERGGVYHYHERRWSRYDTGDGLPSDQVRFVTEADLHGVPVVLAGTTGGPARYDRENDRFVPLKELRGHEVTSVATTDEITWLGTSTGGLFRNDGETWLNVTPRSFSGLAVRALCATGQGLMVGTDRGLFRIVDDTWLPFGPEQSDQTPINALLEITDEEDRGIWVGTDGDGVWILRDSRWSTIDASTGLGNNFVFDLLAWPNESAPKHIYAGTLSGVAEIGFGQWRVIDAARDLPDRSVVSFLETGSPEAPVYWIGTTNGLARSEGESWIDVLPGQSVFALLETTDRGVLAGTAEGLFEYREGRWSRFNGGLPEGSVVSLAEERIEDRFRLWVGMYGEGLWVWADGRFRRAGNLPDGRIEAILPMEMGGRRVVLVGTNRGLVILDGGDTTTIDATSGLPNDTVRSLHLRERQGARELWVGTGGGVAWTPLDRPFQWRTIDDESEPRLPAGTVYRIEEDREGRIYLFTSRGIMRIELDRDSRPRSVRTFTTNEGLPSNEINFGATMVDSGGRIWAGTPLGAALLDPERENPDPAATLSLHSVQINHEQVPLATHYELSPDQRSLTIELLFADLDGGDSALYRAWLSSRTDQPASWTSNPMIELASLPVGTHQLLAEAKDDLGNLYGPLEITISVASPVWRRWWAIAGYGIAAIVLVTLAIYWRERALRRRTVTLENLVRSRTRDLEKTNRDLESVNQALSTMTETDPLTGARNRRWVSLHLASEAERVTQSTRRDDDLLLILVDIDHFKSVNDTFGHAVGDQVLRHFHEVLARTVRDSDAIVRWGGEEFLIIARRTSREEGTMIARRLVEEVRSEPFTVGGESIVRLTASVGLAPFPFDPRQRELVGWEEVLDIADHAMYTVKASGRDGWVALFGGDSPAPPDLLAQLRENPSELIRNGSLHVESSFDIRRIRWSEGSVL